MRSLHGRVRRAVGLTAAAAVVVTTAAACGAAEEEPAPPHRPELASAGTHPDALLYGGTAAALCGLGVLAVAAARNRRE